MHTLFISISPRFSKIGHMPSLCLGIERLAEKFNWKFFNLIPKNYIGKKPSSWLETLMPDQGFQLSLLKSLQILFCLFPKSKKIIYIESFYEIHLKGLILSLRSLNKDNTYLVITYHCLKLSLDFQTLHKECLALLGNDRVVFFSDSQNIVDIWRRLVQCPITLVPCAHLISGDLRNLKKEKKENQIVVWWPGSVRKQKGLNHIHNLSKTTKKKASDLTLVAGRSSNLQAYPKGPKIELIDDDLEREDYLNWLYQSDIIVLPYTEKRYKNSNSGIFIEAIIANKVVFSIENTWMSDELNKYGLNELILDSIDPWHPEKMIELHIQKEILSKIKKMSLDYRNFHSLSQFQDIFQKLLL